MQGPAPCMAFFFCPAQPATAGAAMVTFAETMLAKYETLLQTSAGPDTVSVDGQSVRYVDVEAKYRYWKREVARVKSGDVVLATRTADGQPGKTLRLRCVMSPDEGQKVLLSRLGLTFPQRLRRADEVAKCSEDFSS